MKHILVVEDDASISDVLQEVLTREGYRVTRAWSGTEALLALGADRPDLVLLDLMLPGLPGEEVLQQIRGIPTIVLSARAEVQDKVSLLLAGAADYITKPFDTAELLARIVAALRAAPVGGDVVLRCGRLQLDATLRVLQTPQRQVRLTRTECAILKLLMQNPTQVITKTVLLDHIGTDTPDGMETSLGVHISNLRKKLREADVPDAIETVWGIGFRLCTENL